MMNLLASSPRRAAFTVAGLSLLLGVSCEKKEEMAAAAAPVVPAAVVPEAGVVPAAAAEGAKAAESAGVVPEGGAQMEAFKAEIKGIKAFMEANQRSADAATGLANLRELVKRASAVSTEGLPEDLASAYAGMTGVMQRVQSTLDSLPVPVEQLQDYLTKETAKGAAAAQEVAAQVTAFKTSMDGLQKEGEAAAATLKQAGSKYGIESIDLGGQ